VSKPEIAAGIRNKKFSATALVTGSTSGIGRQTALALARLGCDVYIHGRNEEAGRKVVKEIEKTGQSAKFFEVDFSSQNAVREFGDELQDVCSSEYGLDILVNNAGGYFRNAGTTENDIEYTFAVNHLSHFILTSYLMDFLEESNMGEIINVSSTAHKSGNMDLSTVSGDNVTGGMRAYGRSKLANIMFTKSLDRRLDDNDYNVNVNAIHPGGIPGSGFLRTLPNPLYKVGKKIGKLPVFDQPEDGATTILYALFSDKTKANSGEYYKNTKTAVPTQLARNKEKQEELWVKSVELTGTDWSSVF
jgi:hypothetical protein